MRADNTNFRVVCAGDSAEIYLYDVIGNDVFGGIGAKQFADELNKAKSAKSITLRVNSPGGDVFEGFAMYSLLKAHKASIDVKVDGLAASIASVIAMAGDSIEIASSAYFMIHDPWTMAGGNATELRKQADLLDKVRDSIVETYASRTKQKPADLAEMMAGEKWMNATESVDFGFADSVAAEQAVAACLRPELFRYRNMPKALVEPEAPATIPLPTADELEAIIQAKREKARQEHAS